MSLNLPDDVTARIQAFVAAGYGTDPADVVRKALDAMPPVDPAVQAVQEGMDAYKRGEHRTWDEFAAEFMAERGIQRDP